MADTIVESYEMLTLPIRSMSSTEEFHDSTPATTPNTSPRTSAVTSNVKPGALQLSIPTLKEIEANSQLLLKQRGHVLPDKNKLIELYLRELREAALKSETTKLDSEPASQHEAVSKDSAEQSASPNLHPAPKLTLTPATPKLQPQSLISRTEAPPPAPELCTIAAREIVAKERTITFDNANASQFFNTRRVRIQFPEIPHLNTEASVTHYYALDDISQDRKRYVQLLTAYYYHSHPGPDTAQANKFLHTHCDAILFSPETTTAETLTYLEKELTLRLTNQILANEYSEHIAKVFGRRIRPGLGLDTCEDYQMAGWARDRGYMFSDPKMEQILARRAERKKRHEERRLSKLKGGSAADSDAGCHDRYKSSSSASHTKKSTPVPTMTTKPSTSTPTTTIKPLSLTEEKITLNKSYKVVPTNLASLFISTPHTTKNWLKPLDYLASLLAELSFHITHDIPLLRTYLHTLRPTLLSSASTSLTNTMKRLGAMEELDRISLVANAKSFKDAHEMKWNDENGWCLARDKLKWIFGERYFVELGLVTVHTTKVVEVEEVIEAVRVFDSWREKGEEERRRRGKKWFAKVGGEVKNGLRIGESTQ